MKKYNNICQEIRLQSSTAKISQKWRSTNSHTVPFLSPISALPSHCIEALAAWDPLRAIVVDDCKNSFKRKVQRIWSEWVQIFNSALELIRKWCHSVILWVYRIQGIEEATTQKLTKKHLIQTRWKLSCFLTDHDQRWANNPVFEYYLNTCSQISIWVILSNRISFVFVLG